MLPRWLSVLLVCLIIIPGSMRFALLPWYDARHNAVARLEPSRINPEILGFHQRSFVADLHADSLLWRRDLLQRHSRGQLDLPRLKEGGTDLQVFSVVSAVPAAANYHSNSIKNDSLPLLFIASWRSPRTWFSPKQRALTQAAEFRQLAKQSGIIPVLRRQDLSRDGVKGLLALEGLHALEGDANALPKFYSAGFRIMALTHFHDNAVAGSAHGIERYGLTGLGRRLLPQMEKLGITIDLAHASSAAFTETLSLVSKPVVVSHTGVQGTCPGTRNLSDAQIQAIARNGGVIGIGFWEGAVCDTSIDAIVEAIRYTIDRVGVEYVGLGSDFDGHVTTPFDASGMPLLTAALLTSGLSEADVSHILGANLRRVLLANLPE